MRLMRLELENFQGIRHLNYDFGGGSASIYGDNATGKTTLYNALTWLLFDKASTGAKNFTPKTQDTHHLQHMALGIFELEDGRLVALKKIYHEVYRKRNGMAEEEFSGHTTDYYIDGVPAKEKEYTDTLLQICGDVERMKLLTMPNYFAETLPWESRRKILLEACGDIGMAEVVASTPELETIRDYLRKPGTKDQYYGVEEYRKMAAAQKAEINRRLDEIPNRIDEAQRAMPEVSGLKANQIEDKLRQLEALRQEIEEKKQRTLAEDGAVVGMAQEMAEVKTRLAEAKAAYVRENEERNGEGYERLSKVRAALGHVQEEIQRVKQALRGQQESQEEAHEKCARLREQYCQERDRSFDPGAEICPTCGQRMPEDRISQMHADFNTRKAEALEAINREGKATAAREKRAAQEVERLTTDLQQWEKEEAELRKAIQEARADIQSPKPFEATALYAELTQQIAALETQKQDAAGARQAVTQKYNEQIEMLQAQMDEQREHKAQLLLAQSQQKRILALEAQEKDLAAQFEAVEKGLYLCDLYTRTKVAMLDEKINSQFQSVRFRLFVEQVNGGLREDCEVLVPGEDGVLIPYATANNAGRINAGLEIIGTLSRHWGLQMPVFVDNAEGVTRLRGMDTQVIRLVVSEKDKELRLENNKTKKEAA